MGRPRKSGLSYFPLMIDFFKDRRIRRLVSRFGADGPMLYLYILCEAYGNGYYVVADDDFIEDAALELGCNPEKIGLMLHYLLDKSLLDGTLFNTVKVLSSHGIQAQYQAVMKDLRHDVEVERDFWLLDESETLGFVKVRANENKSGENPDKSGENDHKSGKNAAKEIKRKEIKGKESVALPEAAPHPEDRFQGELRLAVGEWLAYKTEKRQPYKPTGMKSLLTQIEREAKAHGEAAVATVIRESMASNYQGIVFDRLSGGTPVSATRREVQRSAGTMGAHTPTRADLDRLERFRKSMGGADDG